MGLISAPCAALYVCQRSASCVFNGCRVRRKWTRSHASSGLTTSANDGIGDPSSPVMKIRYRSWLVTPHINREPDEKSYGRIGLFLLSVSVSAEGPSPWPCGPWHFQHSNFWKSCLPCRMLSIVIGVSGGMVNGAPGFSLAQRGDHVLTNATRLARSCGVSGRHEGMFVVTKPRVMALYRSSSVGKVPVGVDRHLNVASVK